METLIQRIQQTVAAAPGNPAVRTWSTDGEPIVLDYSELWQQVQTAAGYFQQQGVQQVGLVMTNSPAWVVTDLALLMAGVTAVPVPLGFTEAQAQSLLTPCDLIVCDGPGEVHLQSWTTIPPNRVRFADTLQAGLSVATPPHLEDWICKVIHTSGTTNAPKGVRIRAQGLECLVTELLRHIEGASWQHYLSLVPLSLLIEQVTGVYMTLLRGGCISFLPGSLPLLGTSSVPAEEYWVWICKIVPDALVLTPGMVQSLANQLQALTETSEITNESERNTLLFGSADVPFIACGGGAVSRDALQYLLDAGIRVYEGYGLSENSSVVSWNSPRHFRPGTAGKPLAHVRLKLSSEQELLLKSDSLFAGYLGSDPTACVWDSQGWLNTGDVADIDDDGYVTIRGRRKNVIITASSRNISPEWVESCYREMPFVEDVCVFGEGLEMLWGVFFVNPDALFNEQALTREIEVFGRERLSLLDRVGHIVLKSTEEADQAGWFTVTGRPRRQTIADDVLAATLSTEQTGS